MRAVKVKAYQGRGKARAGHKDRPQCAMPQMAMGGPQTMRSSFLFCFAPLCFEQTESLPSFGGQPLKGPIVRAMLSRAELRLL